MRIDPLDLHDLAFEQHRAVGVEFAAEGVMRRGSAMRAASTDAPSQRESFSSAVSGPPKGGHYKRLLSAAASASRARAAQDVLHRVVASWHAYS